jgi:hypothetical protein
MLTLTPHVKIDFHLPPTDMRKSFDGLTGLVRSVFQADPRDGGNDRVKRTHLRGERSRTTAPTLVTSAHRRTVNYSVHRCVPHEPC